MDLPKSGFTATVFSAFLRPFIGFLDKRAAPIHHGEIPASPNRSSYVGIGTLFRTSRQRTREIYFLLRATCTLRNGSGKWK